MSGQPRKRLVGMSFPPQTYIYIYIYIYIFLEQKKKQRCTPATVIFKCTRFVDLKFGESITHML